MEYASSPEIRITIRNIRSYDYEADSARNEDTGEPALAPSIHNTSLLSVALAGGIEVIVKGSSATELYHQLARAIPDLDLTPDAPAQRSPSPPMKKALARSERTPGPE